MKFGSRQICNVVFRAAQEQKLGKSTFKKGQPVFYLDSAKTSTMEGAATTVYATGGRGNTRLIAWEGEKTLTFTVEDALLSPISFAMLSGAGLIKGDKTGEFVHFHQTTAVLVGSDGVIDLRNALDPEEQIDDLAPLYVMELDNGGDLTGNMCEGCSVVNVGGKAKQGVSIGSGNDSYKNKSVMVDYYVLKPSGTVSELQIDAENFAGNYYVEADTLFRRQSDGKDLPANITFPNVKIQSNFTFSMASSGDPSTFTFTMDALPGYTYFDGTKKVLCAIQIVDDATDHAKTMDTVFKHNEDTKVTEFEDSVSNTQTFTIDFAQGSTAITNDTLVGGVETTVSVSGGGATDITFMYKKTGSLIWKTVGDSNTPNVAGSFTPESTATSYTLDMRIVVTTGSGATAVEHVVDKVLTVVAST